MSMPYRPPTQIADALIAERNQIRAVIANAVDSSLQMAFHSLHDKAGEVEKVIYFFMEGLPIIEAGLNRILAPRASVVVSGIFCHQTPKVRSLAPEQATASCELGDLAILATYDGLPASTGLGNAVLLQAKEHFHPGISTDQELLYETTDTFDYVSPRSLSQPQAPKTPQRSLRHAHSCLYFWELEPRWRWPRPEHEYASTTAFLARPKTEPRHHSAPFEDVVTDLFCGISGRGFQKAPTDNGWSAIIHDLIKNSVKRTIGKKNIFTSHGRPQPNRLYNYVNALREAEADTLVRCSLAEFLAQFEDEELKDAGAKLEAEASKFEWSENKAPSNDQGGGSDLPPLTRGDKSEEGSGGGSFVVFQFKSIAAP